MEKNNEDVHLDILQTNLKILKEVQGLIHDFAGKFDDLEDFVASNGYREMDKITSKLSELFKLQRLECSIKMTNNWSGFTDHRSKARDLLKLYDVLIFDDCVNSFFSSCSNDEKLKYYPVLIWWKITTVIPLRPIEFYSLTYDCIEKKEDGSYWLSLTREKNIKNKDGEEGNPLQINEEMYTLIFEYQEATKEYPKNGLLLSHSLYKEYFVNNNSVQKQFTKYIFNNILEDFFKNIIRGKYGIIRKFEKIKPSDTSHLALCNMILQGLDPLSISSISGQKTLPRQMHYYSSLYFFTESAVYTFATNYKTKIRNSLYQLHNSEIESGTKSDINDKLLKLVKNRKDVDSTVYIVPTKKGIENISINLINRGHFGWLYNLIVEEFFNNSQNHSLDERTRYITVLKQIFTPIQLEELAYLIMNNNFDIERSSKGIYTTTEKNLSELIGNGNEVVHFNIEEKAIKLTFFDGSIARDIDIFVGKNGKLETKLNTTKVK